MGFSDYEVYCPEKNREKLFLTASDLQEILQLGTNTTVQKYPI